VVGRLRAAAAGAAVALLTDAGGRDQPLCAVWGTAALRRALAAVGGPAGVPLRAVLAAADGPVRRLAADPGGPPAWFDCDTEQDLATAREWAGG
jgi:molybdopterin-guanine dinucleotide biosynthesis protein A